jgi:CheY-like chemotaxis protein
VERATLLVCGDHPAVLELIENTLRQRGHRVIATNKPAEALEITRRVRIDLLICDIVADGTALAQQMVAIQPGLHVLSLYDGDHRPDRGEDDTTALRKPVVLGELEAAVVAALNR